MRTRISNTAAIIGAATGSIPTTFSGRVNSSSGTIASSCLITLLISRSSRNRLDKRIEPALKRWPVPVCVSAEINLRTVPIWFDHGPHPLMREEENAAQCQNQKSEPDVDRGASGIILNRQRVRERDLFKVSENNLVAVNK